MNNKDTNINWKKLVCYIILFVVIGTLLFYWIAKDQLRFQDIASESVTPKAVAVILEEGVACDFEIVSPAEQFKELTFLIGTGARVNRGEMYVELYHQGELLQQKVYNTEDIPDYKMFTVEWENTVDEAQGKEFTVRVYSQEVPEGEGVTLWYGNSLDIGKVEVATEPQTFSINGNRIEGTICYSTKGLNESKSGPILLGLVLFLDLLICIYALKILYDANRNKNNFVMTIILRVYRSKFLLQQLVMRDFKRKYKRSVLGAAWSLLNPLLTMVVQYFVFSTLFRANIDNFIAYLLSGIVIFNFFSESVGLGLTSIIDNAALLSKTYVPKYLYPFSRVLTSFINLLLSLIPLIIVSLATGVRLTKAILLLPLLLFLLVLFCCGISYVLSSLAVFFRDIQFLWGVLVTLWSYMTPLFYPISIIPERYLGIYKLNPLYHYLNFLRTILIDGVAPSPIRFFACGASSLIAITIGVIVFRKMQPKFMLNL